MGFVLQCLFGFLTKIFLIGIVLYDSTANWHLSV